MKVYVPLNNKGILELENYSEISSENLKIFFFTFDEYNYLEKLKYLDYLNVECNCLIDLYEDADIAYEHLSKGLDITLLLLKQTDDQKYKNLLGKFVEIFKLALEKKTFINIYCFGEY